MSATTRNELKTRMRLARKSPFVCQRTDEFSKYKKSATLNRLAQFSFWLVHVKKSSVGLFRMLPIKLLIHLSSSLIVGDVIKRTVRSYQPPTLNRLDYLAEQSHSKHSDGL